MSWPRPPTGVSDVTENQMTKAAGVGVANAVEERHKVSEAKSQLRALGSLL